MPSRRVKQVALSKVASLMVLGSEEIARLRHALTADSSSEADTGKVPYGKVGVARPCCPCCAEVSIVTSLGAGWLDKSACHTVTGGLLNTQSLLASQFHR